MDDMVNMVNSKCFVAGRRILDASLLANETVDTLLKKKR